MSDSSMLPFAPYVFLEKQDDRIFLNFWISIPQDYRWEGTDVTIDPATGTRISTVRIGPCTDCPADTLKVVREEISDPGSLRYVKVQSEVSGESAPPTLQSTVPLSKVEPAVEGTVDVDGILTLSPYGYFNRNEVTGDFQFHYLIFSPEDRGFDGASGTPSEGSNYYLGYPLNAPSGGEGTYYIGSNVVPSINESSEGYQYLDTYVELLAATENPTQPLQGNALVMAYNDVD